MFAPYDVNFSVRVRLSSFDNFFIPNMDRIMIATTQDVMFAVPEGIVPRKLFEYCMDAWKIVASIKLPCVLL